MSQSTASIGFAASRRGKKSKDFIPTDKQIETAQRRIICTLNKYNGAAPVVSLGEAVDLFCKQVFNRGEELGSYSGREFKTTIKAALNGLLSDKKIEFSHGRIFLTSGAEVSPQRRPHRQKHPRNRTLLRTA